jgi:hypothetical protein
VAPLALAGLLLAAGARPETIVLRSGQTIEADLVWDEGAELRYRRQGTLYAMPRELVRSIVDAAGTEVTLVDPDVRRSRERLDAGDATEALRYARLAVFREPASVAALEALAAAQLALGQAERARQSAESAVALDPRRSGARELLGDALTALDEPAAAREQYRLALSLGAAPRAHDRLDALGTASASISSARYHIRYDGAADEPLGMAVLRVLDGAWEEHESRLGFAPDLPVMVVLQTETGFRDTTRAPEWAAAWNDGTIRVPVKGLERPTPGLERVLRHELAHSFLASRTGGRCPTWLQEGVARWLEGGDPGRDDVLLAPIARAGRLPRLASLEGPFIGLSEDRATVAYAQSLAAVAHIARRHGEAALTALVAALGEGSTTTEALVSALRLDYPSLERELEAHLRTADRKPAAAPGP